MFEFSILFKSRQTYDVDAARGMRCGVSLALWADVMVKDGGNWFLLWITKSTSNQQFTNNNGNISANMGIELKIINSCKSMVISQLFGRVFAQSLAGFFHQSLACCGPGPPGLERSSNDTLTLLGPAREIGLFLIHDDPCIYDTLNGKMYN